MYSQMMPPMQLIAPKSPSRLMTNLIAFRGLPSQRTNCSNPIPPAPPKPRQAPMILLTSLQTLSGCAMAEGELVADSGFGVSAPLTSASS